MSGLHRVYTLLGVRTPLEMSRRYDEEDQKLMKSGEWDYDNPDLITNKVKGLLEQINPYTQLNSREFEWYCVVLWFWYHHAISCAIRKKDKSAALRYSEIAVQRQPHPHCNRITQLLYYLVRDNTQEAELWVKGTTQEPEKTTSRELLEEYKAHRYFID